MVGGDYYEAVFPNLYQAYYVIKTNRFNEIAKDTLDEWIYFLKTAVFKRVGRSVIEEIEEQKLIWLNTAGLGIIWLHIRMDTSPKYYKTVSYKDPDFLESTK